jgi:hypothetical protein
MLDLEWKAFPPQHTAQQTRWREMARRSRQFSSTFLVVSVLSRQKK